MKSAHKNFYIPKPTEVGDIIVDNTREKLTFILYVVSIKKDNITSENDFDIITLLNQETGSTHRVVRRDIISSTYRISDAD